MNLGQTGITSESQSCLHHRRKQLVVVINSNSSLSVSHYTCTIQYCTYVIDHSSEGLFRKEQEQQLLTTNWLFTTAAEKLNQGQPGTISTSGHNGS